MCFGQACWKHRIFFSVFGRLGRPIDFHEQPRIRIVLSAVLTIQVARRVRDQAGFRLVCGQRTVVPLRLLINVVGMPRYHIVRNPKLQILVVRNSESARQACVLTRLGSFRMVSLHLCPQNVLTWLDDGDSPKLLALHTEFCTLMLRLG